MQQHVIPKHYHMIRNYGSLLIVGVYLLGYLTAG
jgi:hypothetical protein